MGGIKVLSLPKYMSAISSVDKRKHTLTRRGSSDTTKAAFPVCATKSLMLIKMVLVSWTISAIDDRLRGGRSVRTLRLSCLVGKMLIACGISVIFGSTLQFDRPPVVRVGMDWIHQESDSTQMWTQIYFLRVSRQRSGGFSFYCLLGSYYL